MPTEIRRLIFSNHELAAIVADYVASVETTIPKGTLLDFRIEREAPLAVRVFVQTPKGQQVQQVADDAWVTGAILNFCMHNRIPLSRRAEKTIKRTDGGVCLDMVIGAKG